MEDQEDQSFDDACAARKKKGWVQNLHVVHLQMFVSAWSLAVLNETQMAEFPKRPDHDKTLCIPYVYLEHQRQHYFDITRLLKFLSPDTKVLRHTRD